MRAHGSRDRHYVKREINSVKNTWNAERMKANNSLDGLRFQTYNPLDSACRKGIAKMRQAFKKMSDPIELPIARFHARQDSESAKVYQSHEYCLCLMPSLPKETCPLPDASENPSGTYPNCSRPHLFRSKRRPTHTLGRRRRILYTRNPNVRCDFASPSRKRLCITVHRRAVCLLCLGGSLKGRLDKLNRASTSLY